MIKTSLLIKDLELIIFLGWPEEERKHRQSVFVNIEINFPQPPNACETDELDNSFCYANLIEQIQEYASDKTFRLVEYLGAQLYQIIKQSLPNATAIKVEITKHPLIANLNGGVKFRYGDFE